MNSLPSKPRKPRAQLPAKPRKPRAGMPAQPGKRSPQHRQNQLEQNRRRGRKGY